MPIPTEGTPAEATLIERLQDAATHQILRADMLLNFIDLDDGSRDRRGFGQSALLEWIRTLFKKYHRAGDNPDSLENPQQMWPDQVTFFFLPDPETGGGQASARASYVVARFPPDWGEPEFFWIEMPEIPYAAFAGGSIRLEYPSLHLVIEEGLRCRLDRKEFVYRGDTWFLLPEAPAAARVVRRTTDSATPQR